MVDMGFLTTYKGTLYPIPLQAKEDAEELGQNPVKTLVDLCAEKIVQDSTNTSRAVDVIPAELCYSLMHAALSCTRDRAIEVLIAKWPWKVLSLQKLAPQLFTDLAALYSPTYIGDRIRRGVKYTTCLAHTFVECLKKRAPTKLKWLDLTGYPAAEVIVNYLSSHVLLVYNEARQKEIISMYNEVTRNLPEDKRQYYILDTTLPDESYVISLDAFVQTSDTHMELCRALKTSKLEQCRFNLRIHKLHVMCVGVARISVLLEQIDPQYLSALCLQFNGLSNDGLSILVPAVLRLTNLTALDLSYNTINLSYQEQAADMIAQMFSGLPCLTRLDLSNNRIKYKIRRILSAIPQPLQYLKLCGCGLSDIDLQYLRLCHHAPALRELDLSDNSLNKIYGQMPGLLLALSSIVVLELENCRLEPSHVAQLFSISHRLTQLRLLNLCGNNSLTEDVLFSNIPKLIQTDSLEVVKVSFLPQMEVEEGEEDDMVEDYENQKEALRQRLTALINSLCDKAGRKHISILLMS